MGGNSCPNCGKPVMTYFRFFKEAEPYKVSLCGSCGTKLKRSSFVYYYLAGMLLLLAVLSMPLLIIMVKNHLSFWIIWLVTGVWFVLWIFLINYLSWRYIKWVQVDREKQ
jgi:hypothetical protein